MDLELKELGDSIDALPELDMVTFVKGRELYDKQYWGRKDEAREIVVQQFKDEGTIYQVQHFLHGTDALELCDECGLYVNSGSLDLVNPATDNQVGIDLMALHALREHGTAEYSGTQNSGSAPVDDIKKVLGLVEIEDSQ